MRGYSGFWQIRMMDTRVLPVHAGVFLQETTILTKSKGCPRTRGGIPSYRKLVTPSGGVVPVQAGVFHKYNSIQSADRRSAHARGIFRDKPQSPT